MEVWYDRSVEEVLGAVRSSSGGLAGEEAARRLVADGPNELKRPPRTNAWKIFASQFQSLLIWILIVAGAVSGMLGERIDAIAILAIVLLNAVIGFYQEFHAEKSIEALQKMTAPHAKVRRDGAVVEIAAAGIVVGDVLLLEAGDLIAADARLLRAAALQCVEAALTGESEAVRKDAGTLAGGEVALGDRKNLVYLGTSVSAGAGEAVVVETAMGTELGKIADLMTEADAQQETPLQRKLDAVGRVLVWVALGVVAVLFGLGALRGTPWIELFLTSISLAVAAVPEGLPAVVTVALSLGVTRMARRRALVRKLVAVETLGSTSVICTDKTGTLTVGEMTARALYVDGQSYAVSGEGYGPAGEVLLAEGKAAPLLELATNLLGCNNAHLVEEGGVWRTVGDPTEGAMLVAGAKAGGKRDVIEKERPRVREIPFDSDRKRSTVIRRRPQGGLRAYVNGAPGVLLERCVAVYTPGGVRPLTEDDRARILSETAAMAGKALRVLASAWRDLNVDTEEDVERELVFVGLTGMYDPPRPEAKAAIARCADAGIRVVMITGDHPGTAAAIARELGIVGEAIPGAEMDKMSEEQLGTRVRSAGVYARVSAAHKLRIVRALKAGGEVVAMTGDGVNDAPAIRGADIGIAMGRAGTEVTKQAADMVITDDNFATIVAAVEEGRGIYNNIRRALQYLLGGNTGELLLMTVCVAGGLPAPLLPIHLLWINLITDGFPALCLAGEPIDADVMREKPRKRAAHLMDAEFLRTITLTGVLTAAISFGVFVYWSRVGSLAEARGASFAVLVMAELLRSFGARSATKPVWRLPFWGNWKLVAVVLVSVGIQLWSQHNPVLGRFLQTPEMPYSSFFVLLALGAVPLAWLEIVKVARR